VEDSTAIGELARPPEEARERPRRSRIGAQNEARILEAAEQVFADYGFHGATTAMIAGRAGIPKPNLHYYFNTKEDLYVTVLENILGLWLGAADVLNGELPPDRAIEAYIREKMAYSRTRPLASKVFANEIINGAPQLMPVLRGPLRATVERKSQVIRRWIAAGLIDPIEPEHLFFTIWATTQTYADFGAQTAAVLGKPALDDADFEAAADFVCQVILKGIGARG